MRCLILDVYNVIHAVPELARHLDRSLEAARAALLQQCVTYRTTRRDADELCVVFDGRTSTGALPTTHIRGIRVQFTEEAEEADTRILELLKRAGPKVACTVVSNDTYVITHARADGAKVISAAEWAARLRPPAARPQRRGRASGGPRGRARARRGLVVLLR